ncbi:hypothetical protein FKW77_009489 [Venturia effusa]|uniref:Uncharacterized protein n=1 Tax=Venturia effusa TaxID=50376 RepID=A0A517LD00_9PEZI|nr:hypothetical protein FKW77_009489 [Venturia effusa]
MTVVRGTNGEGDAATLAENDEPELRPFDAFCVGNDGDGVADDDGVLLIGARMLVDDVLTELVAVVFADIIGCVGTGDFPDGAEVILYTLMYLV